MTRFVDLSHPIEDGMEVYMGFPPPQVGALISREESRERYRGQAEFLIGKIDMPLNVGTYLDSPFHRFERGTDVAGVPLERLAGLPGVVVDGTSGGVRAIPPDVLAGRDLAGRAVLFRTGWDSRWGTDGYAVDPPFLPRDTVERLVSAGVTLVGVDFPNVTTPPIYPGPPIPSSSKHPSPSWSTCATSVRFPPKGSGSPRFPHPSWAQLRSP